MPCANFYLALRELSIYLLDKEQRRTADRKRALKQKKREREGETGRRGRGRCMHSHPIIIRPVVPSLALSLIGNKQLRVKSRKQTKKIKKHLLDLHLANKRAEFCIIFNFISQLYFFVLFVFSLVLFYQQQQQQQSA